jgi:diguanylate cyclase (GGDEF)-like protein
MGKLLYKIDKIRKLDSLTQVFNREQIEKKIAKEFSRCTRYRRNASLIMIDIDKFKNINDRYGHQAGDRVIIDLVETIRKEMRADDIVGRYGGDEFIIIMPETTVEAARKFSDRLSAIIDNKNIIYDNNTIKYSVSMGISAVDFSHSNYENWLKLTDTNLYRSKSKSDLPLCRY